MPVIKCNYNDLLRLIGTKIEKKELIEKIPMIGADIDKVEGDDINIEFFPDRPDLLSIEGVARALRAFLGIKKGLTRYEVKPSAITLNVDSSVKKIRPYIVAALVDGIETDEKLILSMMDLQEKLHFSIGKDRKKMAIGLHDAKNITPPFTYKAVDPQSISFIPLAKNEEMNLEEILKKHEKGIEFSHLLTDYPKYPILIDAKKNVLSFPPIINGELTAVNLTTKKFFIDVTGTDKKAINTALNIMSTALAERGGQIKSVKIVDTPTVITPDLSPIKKSIETHYMEKILGKKIGNDAIEALKKMGYDTQLKNGKIDVIIPKWRIDILHQIDLIEDVAIGYGYNNFPHILPKSSTFGSEKNLEKLYMIMIGLGFNEIMTLSLSNKEEQYKKIGLEEGNSVEIENPITEKHSCLRQMLLPSVLNVLNSNKHHDLPQKIFEIGNVVDEKAKNSLHLCGMKIAAKTGFTECKSIVKAILRDIGMAAKLEGQEHPAFIKGRCAAITFHGEKRGFFGEIAPQIIENFELGHPIIAFEVNVESLKKEA